MERSEQSKMPTAVYNGLRIYQYLLNTSLPDQRIVIDLDRIREDHPAWIASLAAAHEWLTKILLADSLSETRSTMRRGVVSRLTDETIIEVRDLRKRRMSYQKIADATGISIATVYKLTRDIPGRRRKMRRTRARA